tara:strand:- start:128 stop:682 length:555 start_codon:yes stop_codon:yes gene_type:complete
MNFAILASGEGTTAAHLLKQNLKNVTWCGVITDNPKSGVITRCKCTLIEKIDKEPKHSHEARIINWLRSWQVDIIILAGFMRILSAKILSHYPAINIHPSLLPKHKGKYAVKNALQSGDNVSGCTIHWVDQGVDTGQIIAQREVPVRPNDTETTLRNRIHNEELILYPKIIEQVANTGLNELYR